MNKLDYECVKMNSAKSDTITYINRVFREEAEWKTCHMHIQF